MFRLQGQRANTSKYILDNYLYNKDSSGRGNRYRCISKSAFGKCNAAVLVKPSGEVKKISVHNHPPHSLIEREPVIRALKDRARIDQESFPNEVVNATYRR